MIPVVSSVPVMIMVSDSEKEKKRKKDRLTVMTVSLRAVLLALAPHMTRQVPFSFSFLNCARDFFRSNFKERFRVLSMDNNS